jgi:lipopolysaccharide transport system ATP-binding protein
MTVRLGFAIAAHLDPEILVVDEVLAVGDAEFQKKAIGKMQDVSKGEGRTVLFVSHNMDSIQALCNKGIVLKNGLIEYIGDIDRSVQIYQNIYFENNKSIWEISEEERVKSSSPIIEKFALIKNDEILNNSINENDNIEVEIHFSITEFCANLTIGISLFDEKGHYIYRALHTDLDSSKNKYLKIGKNKLKAIIETKILNSGTYRVVLDVSLYNISWIVNPYEEYKRVLTFTKEKNTSFSTMQTTSALITPTINWSLNEKL